MTTIASVVRFHDEFGPNGEVVAEFLDEVSSRGVDWPRFTLVTRTDAARDAMKATGHLRWPSASLQDAVDGAALDAFTGLGLSRADVDKPLAMGLLRHFITMTAKAIALADTMPPDVLAEMLGPFADAGFGSATGALASLPDRRA